MVKQYTMRRRTVVPKPAPPPAEPSKFNIQTLEQIADDLQTGKIPLKQVTISDEMTTGLRAIVRNSGKISYHVDYVVSDEGRCYLKVGDHPLMTMANARKLAQTIKTLGDQGIDPQAGLHERLIRELLDKGEKWRP